MVDNEQIIAYSKSSLDGTNQVLVVVNLDPHYKQSGFITLPLEDLGLDPTQVRKDLAVTGIVGRPKIGYNLDALLEAIVGLPTDMFYNTGISTYVWILSNRKPAHRQGKVQLIDARRFFTSSGIAAHLDTITISGEEGVMKPDERIYRIALGRLNVEPNEAIFVDDFSENVVAARMLGMTGVHFADPQLARRELMILTAVE